MEAAEEGVSPASAEGNALVLNRRLGLAVGSVSRYLAHVGQIMICLKITSSQYTDPDHDLYHLAPLFHVCSLQRRTPSRPSSAYVALWLF